MASIPRDEGTVRLSSKGESDRITQRLAVQILCLPKTPSELKTQRFRAFMRSWCDHDELSFRRPFHSGSLQFSNPYHPAVLRDLRGQTDTCSRSPCSDFVTNNAAPDPRSRLRPPITRLCFASITSASWWDKSGPTECGSLKS